MSGVLVMWVGRLLSRAMNYCHMSLLILAAKRLNQALGISIMVPVLPSQLMEFSLEICLSPPGSAHVGKVDLASNHCAPCPPHACEHVKAFGNGP